MPNLESSPLWINKELPEGQKDKQDAQIDRQLEFKNVKDEKGWWADTISQMKVKYGTDAERKRQNNWTIVRQNDTDNNKMDRQKH